MKHKLLCGCVICEPDGNRGDWQILFCPLHEAAPAMLEAVKALDPMFDNDSPLLRVYAAEIRAARALLAKVKGE